TTGHPLTAIWFLRCRTWRLLSWRLWCWLFRSLTCRLHILRTDAAKWIGGLNACQIDALFTCQFSCRWSCNDIQTCCSRRCFFLFIVLDFLFRFCFRFLFCRFRRTFNSCSRFAAFVDSCNRLADCDVVTFFGQKFDDDTCIVGIDFDVYFICLQLTDRITFLHFIPRFYEPLRDRAFRNGFGQLWNDNFLHYFFLPLLIASFTMDS